MANKIKLILGIEISEDLGFFISENLPCRVCEIFITPCFNMEDPKIIEVIDIKVLFMLRGKKAWCSVKFSVKMVTDRYKFYLIKMLSRQIKRTKKKLSK